MKNEILIWMWDIYYISDMCILYLIGVLWAAGMFHIDIDTMKILWIVFLLPVVLFGVILFFIINHILVTVEVLLLNKNIFLKEFSKKEFLKIIKKDRRMLGVIKKKYPFEYFVKIDPLYFNLFDERLPMIMDKSVEIGKIGSFNSEPYVDYLFRKIYRRKNKIYSEKYYSSVFSNKIVLEVERWNYIEGYMVKKRRFIIFKSSRIHWKYFYKRYFS